MRPLRRASTDGEQRRLRHVPGGEARRREESSTPKGAPADDAAGAVSEVIDKASTCASCTARDAKRRPRKNAASRARYHRKARQSTLRRLRRRSGRRGEMRELRTPIISLLGRAQGNARPSAALHRGRARHGRRARTARLLGGGRHVPRIRRGFPVRRWK